MSPCVYSCTQVPKKITVTFNFISAKSLDHTKQLPTFRAVPLFNKKQCYNVFGLLIAAYKDLQSREDTRNGAWQQEGWDEVVYYTGEQKKKKSFSKHKVMK